MIGVRDICQSVLECGTTTGDAFKNIMLNFLHVINSDKLS